MSLVSIRHKALKALAAKPLRRGLISVTLFFILWELAAKFEAPIVGAIPAPSAVLKRFLAELVNAYYWRSWGTSLLRIMIGFIIAQILGAPLGLLLGVSRRAREIIFPLIEVMRPIPPLAWVPVSVIFWPSAELSMIFVTFLGAFFTVVLNIVEGISAIDIRFLRAAASLGSTKRDIFWRVMLPASLP
ncbi:MAG: ABC transporter permease subunit, partial [Deltaproteobacteria bacterium]|nr:ABC transporter permease subunit [Deltaproteobacteria bacterium]